MSLSVSLRHVFPDFALDVAFDAPRGVTALFGRSGSGKTTIVNAVAGLLRPDEGRVSIDDFGLFDTRTGLWLRPHRRQVGYVFQEGRLFPHLTVRQNLLYGRWFAGGRRDAIDFDHVVELLGIEALLGRRPAALSGGEKQRVAIGRALLSRPRLLLMDEPLASLDERRKAEVLPYLGRLRDEAAVPILYVSHSVAEVAQLATTVVALDSGKVVRAGPAADVLSDPGIAPVLGVREAGSVISARIVAHYEDGLSEVEFSGGRFVLPRVSAGLGTGIRIRIHAQDVILSRSRPEGLSALNIVPATVSSVRIGEGPGVMVQLLAGSDHLLARITRRSAAALGLGPGVPCFAIVKTVSIARIDVGLEQPEQIAAAEFRNGSGTAS